MFRQSVIVNLCRLIPANEGSGGAGWFSLFFARSVARLAELTVFVNDKNKAMIASFMSSETCKLYVVHDINSSEVRDRIARAHVYIDPLNGLEPEQIPASVYTIAVLHDFMFLEAPYFFTNEELKYRAANYGSSISRADLVLTVSAQQAENIRKFYGKTEVEWIAQFPYFRFGPDSNIVKSASSRFLLYPGVQWNHKNHFRLIAAFLGICERQLIDEDVNLVISQMRAVEANSSLHLELIRKSSHGARVQELPYLSPASYSGVVKAAAGVVFPSLYEGYGIPVVEAVANGLPILTSRTPSLQSLTEIPPFLHILEDPENIGSMARALIDFLRLSLEARPSPQLAPTAESFDETVARILARAGARPNRGEQRRPAPTASLPRRPRRSNTIAVHVYADSLSADQNDAFGRLAESEVGLPIQLIVYAPLAELQAAGHEQTRSGNVRYTASDAVAELGDITLIHELVIGSSRYNLVVEASEIGSITGDQLTRTIDLLAQSHFNAIELRRGGKGLSCWGEFAEFLRGHVFDLEALPIDFDASQSDLLMRMRERFRARAITEHGRFLICDPSLADQVGHHAGVARALARGAFALGYEVSIAGHLRAPRSLLAPEPPVQAIFEDYLYGGHTSSEAFAQQLEAIAGDELISRDSKVTLFCATPAMLAGAINFLIDRPASLRPIFLIRFDRGESRAPRVAIGYGRALQLIKQLGLRRHFRFFAESLGLQQYFKDISGEEFPLLFNNVDDPNLKLDALGLVRVPSTERALTIVFLGEARVEKGFQFLPAIVDYVIAQRGGMVPLRFRLQVSASQQNETEEIVATREALKLMAQRDPRIELLGYLDNSAYIEAVHTANVVLLPYLPTEYTMRGSGVATEAAAAGKPMVVSRGTDIYDTYKDGGVIIPEEQNEVGLGSAVCRLIDDYAYWRQRALDYRQKRTDLFGDEINFVRRLVAAPAVQKPEGKFVLWISNDTVGEGSSVVYTSQLNYLSQRGYQVIKIVAPYPNRANVQPTKDFNFLEFFKTWTWRPHFSDCKEYLSVADELAAIGNSYDRFVSAWTFLQFPEKLARWLQQIDFKFAVINYAHHAAILNTLDIRSALPRIVETHDIQAVQYAIQQKREIDDAEVQREFEALRAFDHLVSISASETKTFQTAGLKNVTWCLPCVEPDTRGAALGQRYGVLVVGSDHDANVLSIRWFIHNVYRPFLYTEGVTLAVVGSVCGKLDGSFLADRVTYFGRVESLHPYYEASDLVALPIVAGAGVPIKVLDAFARGAPFTLSSFPASAIGLQKDFPVADSAYAMAHDILDLLDDPEKRAARARLGQEFYSKNAAREVYAAKWTRILRSLGETHLVDPDARPATALASTHEPVSLHIGKTYDLSEAKQLATACTIGWHGAEKQGIWSRGEPAVFECALIDEHGEPLSESFLQIRVRLQCKVYIPKQSPTAVVEIGGEDEEPEEWEFKDGKLQTREIVLPITRSGGHSMVRFRVHRLNAVAPDHVAGSKGARTLGLWIEKISFESVESNYETAPASGNSATALAPVD